MNRMDDYVPLMVYKYSLEMNFDVFMIVLNIYTYTSTT